jgi:hypothetical protein
MKSHSVTLLIAMIMNLALGLEKVENPYIIPFEMNYSFFVRGMKFKLILFVSLDLCPAEWFVFPGQSAGGFCYVMVHGPAIDFPNM